jgi:NADH dehydrogenase [ubiquinone] 1 alpha subcomplex assembly factor 7|eukprot:g5566.t1
MNIARVCFALLPPRQFVVKNCAVSFSYCGVRGRLGGVEAIRKQNYSTVSKKSKKTDLQSFLTEYINVRGAISLSEYMKLCLVHPTLGYYCRTDVFGTEGDFTTSPEISQVFGELVGIWCVSNWIAIGKPSQISIVELGPGRGTLMKDIMRVTKQFPEFRSALSVNFVERSPVLREIQAESIKCNLKPNDGNEATSGFGGSIEPETPDEQAVDVAWFEEISSVPQGMPTLFIAQEFFDALPVHQFKKTDNGWCEVLVDNDFSDDGPHHFRSVLSPSPTIASRAYLGQDLLQYRPTTAKKNGDAATADSGAEDNPARDFIEVSPVGMAVCEDIAKRIASDDGAALIVDYGHRFSMESSVRGIKGHDFVSIFQEPGLVDLSIDVDFSTLETVTNRVEGVKSAGVVEQGAFLRNMGIEFRIAKLLENATDDEAQDLIEAYERLTGENENDMGRIYKVMGIVNSGREDACEGFPPEEQQQ